ncbi:MAG: phosphatidate cytidylyltransferase [Bacteriovoracaceae bacterium]
MSNTTVRIISGAILVVLVGLCLYLGKNAVLVGLGVIGSLIIDEIITNFYDQRRFSLRYLFAQLFFILAFWFFNFFQISKSSFNFLISAGVLQNIFMLSYLFIIYKKSDTLLKIFRATSWGIGFFVLLPIMSLSYIIHFDGWQLYFIGLLLLNFMVDTAAYFCGKKFGKHKLWESVSPKKTIEGAIGGVFFSVLATCIYWDSLIDSVSWYTVGIFAIIACCSQVGDLFQSKLKRQFDLKDSSSLIPGHGGVYDRVDSLLFVAPLFAFYLMANF